MRARPRPPLQGRGIFTGTGVIIAGLTATLVAILVPIWSYADRSDTGLSLLKAGTVTTPYGPLSALDRDFVTKVRLAGLWELPAGQQAEQKGTTQAVRTAGEHLVAGHTFLDARVRDVAAKLGLALPNEPNDQQKQWLATLNQAQGVDYDRQFANILRLAHGRVFSVVAEVRASTQNSWSARWPTTPTAPSSTTSRSWRPPGTSTSRPWPRIWPATARRPWSTPPRRPVRRPTRAWSCRSPRRRTRRRTRFPRPPPVRPPSPRRPLPAMGRFRTNGTSHTDNAPSGL